MSISLPSSLTSQLSELDSNDSRFNYKGFSKKSLKRKALRKEERKLKKQKMNLFQTGKSKLTVLPSENIKKTAKLEKSNIHLESDSEKRDRIAEPNKKKKKREISNNEKLETLKKQNPHFHELLTGESKFYNSANTSKEKFEQDDKLIKMYAKKLKLKKVGKIPSNFADDGLDFLFEDLTLPGNLNSSSEYQEGDKERSDLDETEFGDQSIAEDSDDFEGSQVGEEEKMSLSDSLNFLENLDEEEGNSVDNDAVFSSGEYSNSAEEDENFSDNYNADTSVEDEKRSTDVNIALSENTNSHFLGKNEQNRAKLIDSQNKYVPPHLRLKSASLSNTTDTNIKLKKQLIGLSNKLSDMNIGNIVDEVEVILRNNTRNEVTTEIINNILNQISDPSLNLLDSFHCLHAAFVSSLTILIGNEFAATFIQKLIETFETERNFYLNTQNVLNKNEVGGDSNAANDLSLKIEHSKKKSSNLVTLFTFCYNFNLINSSLLIDLIKLFLESGLNELDIENLLRMLKICGSKLRNDDPTAVKEIVVLLQKTVKEVQELSPRAKYMVETITNLKNNKKQKQKADGLANILQTEKLLKFLQKRGLKEPLRVTLKDIRDVPEKGKWWVVGAAWVGREENFVKEMENSKNVGDLEMLARAHGMNTDVRRSIFIVLMSSEDCVDAFNRLSRVNLNATQQREIVKVLLHCCAQEKVYNPYYTLVLQKFLLKSHSFKITFRFTLWDQLKLLKEKEDINVSLINNLSRLTFYLIFNESVDFTVLKVLDFTDLNDQQILFLRILFGLLLFNKNELKFRATFKKIVKSNELQQKNIQKNSKKRKKVEGSLDNVEDMDNNNFLDGLGFFFNKYVKNEIFRKKIKRVDGEEVVNVGGFFSIFFANFTLESIKLRIEYLKTIFG
ncbi:suppressor of glycerol defect [Clydaea vesicula]|uniref:Suppressor of glycerol defect n=1 Tax=Clydaea vesicula TaxID=447962 RepID=A0AAD5U7U9_9FUNG|nr:suppressor of glycerol defect [Clydaea vesicula]